MRERIERLFDPGTLPRDRRARRARGTYDDDGELADFLPANMVVRPGRDRRAGAAVVQGDDFTVRGGAADAAIWQKMVYAERLAHDLRLPLVRLVDGTGGGGSVKSLEHDGLHVRAVHPRLGASRSRTSRRVPVVAAALGPVAGLGAARVVASHFSVIVRGTAQLFVAGPPVVAAAMGESPDKEALGGVARRRRARARSTTRRPTRTTRSRSSSASSPTCRRACGSCRRWSRRSDPADRREEELLSIVPRDRRKPYDDARDPRGGLRPRARVFELGARHGRSLITALARLDGRPGRRARLATPSTTAAA